jgi:hypothetical protein
MNPVQSDRFTAEIDGDFVVFLIGMRINRLLLVHKWLRVFRAMPRMLKELAAHPEFGFLGGRAFLSGRVLMTVQYWRSFDQLHEYAHARDKAHLPAWAEFNRHIGYNDGAVGIFHETYLVPAGQYECVYGNMPRFGLGQVARWVPAVGRMQTAKARLRQE